MDKQKKLWERLAKSNSKYYIASHKGHKITEKEFRDSGIRDYIDHISYDGIIPKKGVCIEIGCGTGRMTEFLAEKYTFVVGTDISSEMIKQAKERLKDIQNIDFIETDGYTLPLNDGVFDFAFSYIVFQHFKTKEMIESNFKEVYRVLKPNAIFKVLVRSDRVDIDRWWAGVKCDERLAIKAGFKLLKKEKVKNYALWLWLQKS